MNKLFVLLMALTIALFCAACGASLDGEGPALKEIPPLEETPAPTGESHVHALTGEDNMVAHEMEGYCGNTETTVSYHPGGRDKDAVWEKSFDDVESVALTDLLRYLDYRGEVCKCLPEYTVDTELGEGYGVNLTEGYVRYDGGQVQLTAEQAEEIQGIMAWLAEE